MKYHKKVKKLAAKKYYFKPSSVIQSAISRYPRCFTEPGSFKAR